MSRFTSLFLRFSLTVVALAALDPSVPGAISGSTRLLRTPTVSATQIAFAYANNIWIVERAGGVARRVTSFPGQTTNPHFSPDGKSLAFSADYEGNTDVYVVPSEGGEPKRLTWHPGADSVEGWTPDGKNVIFTSLARHLGAERDSPILGSAARRRGRARRCRCLAAYRGKDFARRYPHRLPHE